MSWLADLLHTAKGPTMTIELAHESTTTSHAPAPSVQTELPTAVVEAMHPRLGTADALDGETLERHAVATGNARLQGLARRVAAARSRLCDLVAVTAALSEAEDARHYAGADPEAWLLGELETTHSLIAEAEAGRKRMEARRIARSNRVTPLAAAVGNRQAVLIRERDTLKERLYLLSKGIDQSPTQLLRQAGLTPAQIKAVGEIRPGELERIKTTERLAVIEPEIAAIERWYSSGYRDHQHLAGLGFDALIAGAKPVDEVGAA